MNTINIKALSEQVARLDGSLGKIAPLVPKIPKDYSTDEVNTGLKWIDGKEIYRKAFTGNIAAITSTATQPVGTMENIDIVGCTSVCKTADNTSESVNRFGLTYIYSTGAINLLALPTAYSEGTYTVIIDYVKVAAPSKGPDSEPDEVPEDEPETKKATKKKSTK